ncbi:MAG: hypothetical protein WA989_06055, partial [Henriciella sp.]
TLRMRALTSAILFFVLNLIGLGLGPLVVGMLSDAFTVAGMASPLGTAMLICGVIAASGACLLYVLAARTVREDVALLDAPEASL